MQDKQENSLFAIFKKNSKSYPQFTNMPGY